MLLANAVANTDGSVPEVRSYLRSEKFLDGFNGHIEFDEAGDNAAANFVIKSMEDYESIVLKGPQ